MTSLAQPAEVRRVQREAGRIYLICYSEHFATRCTVKGGELVAAGAIGCVIDHEVLAMPNRGDAQRSALARDGGGDDQCDTVVLKGSGAHQRRVSPPGTRSAKGLARPCSAAWKATNSAPARRSNSN
jgi:hypothetical protein